MSLFFVQADDDNWINCHQIRLIVHYCIKKEVECVETAEALFDSDIIDTIFAQLCSHSTSRNYINYLLKELLGSKFTLDQITKQAAESTSKTSERKQYA